MNTTKLNSGKWIGRLGDFDKFGWEQAVIKENLDTMYDSEVELLRAAVAQLEKECTLLRRHLWEAQKK